MLARLSPTQQALLAAAQYIRDHGWLQHDLGYRGGPRCAIGAILSVRGTSVWLDGGDRILEQVHKVVGCQWLPVWNDAPGRTKEEVIAALEQAALT